MDSPRLLEIRIADGAGTPMEPVRSVKAIEGIGLEGDRYATQKGSFSATKIGNRQVTLIESEAIEDARTQEKINLTFGDTRRNLLTIGVQLNPLVGKKFFVGDVLVEGVELCKPCKRPGELSGKDDIRDRFKEVLQGRGGIRVRILRTGEIKEGDAIRMSE